jgi:hypothetical protein
MSKLIKQLIHVFANQPSALEVFLNSRNIKTHEDVEIWTKYWEFKGL